MPNTLSIPPHILTPALLAVVEALQPAETRLVGGLVRDLIANQANPNQALDLDLATQATPQQTLERLQQAGIKAVPTGLEHGTITAVRDGQTFEITSLRKDVSTDGRRATVEFTEDFKTDSQRRDFTFNALYLGLDGTLYDYHTGVEDLENGIVRFIGDAETRIKEDYLRIVRFARFYARFGKKTPEDYTKTLLRKNGAGLHDISAERITSEFAKMFSAPNPHIGWRMLREVHALDELGFTEPKHYDTDCLEKHNKLFPDANSPIERFCCLYGLYASLVAEDSLLMFSNHQRKVINAIVDGLTHFNPSASTRDLLYTVGNEGAPAVLRIMVAEAARHRDSETEVALLAKLDEIANMQAPVFPLKGEDVINLGIPAGPLVGEILAQIEDWWQEADFPDRDACMEQLETLLGHGRN